VIAMKTRNMKSFGSFVRLMLLLSPMVALAEDPVSADTMMVTSEQKMNTPLTRVTDVVNGLVRVVAENKGDSLSEVRRSKMRDIIGPLFDFEEMSQRSLGSNWASATPEQRKEFVHLFSELLANTYLKRLENIEQGMVEVVSDQVKADKAIVRTKVDYKGDKFPLDYKMMSKAGNWHVYDVVIENIGLVTNYRTEFASIVRKEKMTGLIEKLRERSKTGDQGI
jgi:phospholipid transport system substrate-binding protein